MPNVHWKIPQSLKQTKICIQENSIPLLLGIIIAVCWINASPSSYAFIFGSEAGETHFLIIPNSIFGYEASFLFLINDGFMVFFFGMAAKGITEAILPGGSLNPIRKALCPLFATIGGILGPIVIFFVILNVQLSANAYGDQFSTPVLSKGWGVPTATDISLAWLVAKAVFGKKHPAIDFLLLLAIADDAIGLAIIAIFYPDPSKPVRPVWICLVLTGMIVAYAMRRLLRLSFWIYYVSIPGLISWIGLMKSGIHPALALVPIVPFIPPTAIAETRVPQCFLKSSSSTNPLQQFEDHLKAFVDFGMFFFGLANAGVRFSQFGHMTICIALALIVGKPLGIASVTFLITGFKGMDSGLSRKETLMISMIGGLGLTVALFVAGVAFEDVQLQEQAKLGALIAAIFVGISCVLAGKVCGYRSQILGEKKSEGKQKEGNNDI